MKWAAFLGAGSVGVYAEYGSVIFMIALVLAALWNGRPRRWATALAGGLVLLTLVPWIPQVIRGQDQVGVTKFDPMFATPSINGLRDLVVTLALGEHGGTGSTVGRWLEFAVMLGFGIAGLLVLRRSWDRQVPRARRTIQLLTATALLTLTGYALAAVVGIDVFTQRYLTILVPLVAGLGGAVLASIDRPRVLAVAALLLAGLGFAGVARRFGGQFQPDLAPRPAGRQRHAPALCADQHTARALLPSVVQARVRSALQHRPGTRSDMLATLFGHRRRPRARRHPSSGNGNANRDRTISPHPGTLTRSRRRTLAQLRSSPPIWRTEVDRVPRRPGLVSSSVVVVGLVVYACVSSLTTERRGHRSLVSRPSFSRPEPISLTAQRKRSRLNATCSEAARVADKWTLRRAEERHHRFNRTVSAPGTRVDQAEDAAAA